MNNKPSSKDTIFVTKFDISESNLIKKTDMNNKIINHLNYSSSIKNEDRIDDESIHFKKIKTTKSSKNVCNNKMSSNKKNDEYFRLDSINNFDNFHNDNSKIIKKGHNHKQIHLSKDFISKSDNLDGDSESKEIISFKSNKDPISNGFPFGNSLKENSNNINSKNNIYDKELKNLNAENEKGNYVRNIKDKNTMILSELYNQINRFDYYQCNKSIIEADPMTLKSPPRKLYERNPTKGSEENDLQNSYFKNKLCKTKITYNNNNLFFWTKEKMELIREKFRTASEKIKKKTESDFGELYQAIRHGDRDFIL